MKKAISKRKFNRVLAQNVDSSVFGSYIDGDNVVTELVVYGDEHEYRHVIVYEQFHGMLIAVNSYCVRISGS